MTSLVKESFSSRQVEGHKLVSSIAMALVLISFSMLFAALFLGYAVYRMQNPVWPPMGMQRVPLTLPSISTLMIGISSLFYVYFQKGYESFSKKQMKIGLFSTFLFALLFVGSQFLLWSEMHSIGLFVEAGVFPSLLYAFTWIHAAHIGLGLICLLFLLPVLSSGELSFKMDNRIINIGKFWHFLGLIWLIIYLVLFVF